MKKSTYYSWIWEDTSIYYEFEISPNNLKLKGKYGRELLLMLSLFHKDYVQLSKKHQIGEIFTSEFLEYNECLIERDYLDCFEQVINDFGQITFFPCWINNESIIEKLLFCPEQYDISQIMFSSKVYHHNKQGDIVNKYIYGMHTGSNLTKFDYLSDWQKNKYTHDKILDFYTEGIKTKEEYLIYPIRFIISIKSDIFYPFLHAAFFKDSTLDRQKIDNRKIAYLNAPRFNSYLRDLKDIFVNKYGWNFNFQGSLGALEIVKYLCQDGILLDGKTIIYQEDIEAGYVNMETFEWIGPRCRYRYS